MRRGWSVYHQRLVRSSGTSRALEPLDVVLRRPGWVGSPGYSILPEDDRTAGLPHTSGLSGGSSSGHGGGLESARLREEWWLWSTSSTVRV